MQPQSDNEIDVGSDQLGILGNGTQFYFDDAWYNHELEFPTDVLQIDPALDEGSPTDRDHAGEIVSASADNKTKNVSPDAAMRNDEDQNGKRALLGIPPGCIDFWASEAAKAAWLASQKSTDTGSNRSSPSKSSGSSKKSPLDPECCYAPDFMSAAGPRKKSESRLPICLKGNSMGIRDLIDKAINSGMRREDDSVRSYSDGSDPMLQVLEVLEASANAIYPDNPTGLTVSTLQNVLRSLQYREWVQHMLTMRRETAYNPGSTMSGGYGVKFPDGAPQPPLPVSILDALGAAVAVHDRLHGGSHRVGIVDETAQMDGNTPVFNVVVLDDGRSLDERCSMIWLCRSRVQGSRRQQAKWSKMSCTGEDARDVYCAEPNCYRGYASTKELHNHQRQVHAAEYVQCQKCDGWFKGKHNLKNHMAVHEDVQYHCDECTYSKRWRYNVVRHKQAKYKKKAHLSPELP